MRTQILALAIVSLTVAAPAFAQQSAGGGGGGNTNGDAQQNVRESHQYDQLVCSNAAFRAKRIQQECGPITDPQLHQSCVATFDCGKPGGPVNYRGVPASEKVH